MPTYKPKLSQEEIDKMVSQFAEYSRLVQAEGFSLNYAGRKMGWSHPRRMAFTEIYKPMREVQEWYMKNVKRMRSRTMR